jgi:hypothetical protein
LEDARGQPWAVQRIFISQAQLDIINGGLVKDSKRRNYEVMVTGFDWTLYGRPQLLALFGYLCEFKGVKPSTVRVHQPPAGGAVQLYIGWEQMSQEVLREVTRWAIGQISLMRMGARQLGDLRVVYAFHQPGKGGRDLRPGSSF